MSTYDLDKFDMYIYHMYMRVKGKLTKFEWDKWNLNKSYFKHGVTPKETEEVFIDEWSYVMPDIKHSKSEKRFIIIGKTTEKINLFIAFVVRRKKIRVISARRMHRDEVLKYEKLKENTKI
jgi:uncharacterized DUF497 family protein